jgi:hypothetical protein
MAELFEVNNLNKILGQQLREWRERETNLCESIDRDTAERSALREKIEAAEKLLGFAPSEGKRGGRLHLENEIEALMADGENRSPNTIRTLLIARGVDPAKVKSSSGYFYTTLSRMVVKGMLKKLDYGDYVRTAPKVVSMEGGGPMSRKSA